MNVALDSRDRSDAIELRWSYPDARLPRRVVFEPRSDGAWLRRESVWVREGEWRQVGSEIVDDVAVSGTEEVVNG